MKKIKAVVAVLLCVIMALTCLCGCSFSFVNDDIIILFTGNVSGGADNGVGYSGVSAFRKQLLADHNFVNVIDCGNSLCSGDVGLVSQGEYAAQLMEAAGYDFSVLGANDFAADLETVSEDFDGTFISSTADYTGDGELAIEDYVLESFAGKKVALLGITPHVSAEGFDSAEEKELASSVQESIDAAKEEGAEYVLAFSSLTGDDSKAIAASLSGLDGIFCADDGASPETLIKDADDNNIIYLSCGSDLAAIGQIVITTGGTISTSVVKLEDKDEDVDSIVSELNEDYAESMNKVYATTTADISLTSSSGLENAQQKREVPVGDLVADAYRSATGAQIAFVAADEIAAAIPAGEVNSSAILAVTPAKATIVRASLTGQQIADILEFAAQKDMSYPTTDEPGDFAGFLQVSGIKFSIKTYNDTTVVLDENGNYSSIGDTRRVSDIQVLNESGSYEDIDTEKTYTVAGSEALLSGTNNGNTIFNAQSIEVSDDDNSSGYTPVFDYQAVMTYIGTTLSGDLSSYYSTDGRITVSAY